MKKQFLILFAFISVLALSQVPQRFNKVIVTGDITSPKFIKTGSTADSVLLGNGSARAISTIKTDTVNLSNRINSKATGTGTANGTNTGDETLTSIKTKLGAATPVSDGYLRYQDFADFSDRVSNATHTGDATGSAALTLATVNSNVGTFNNITINAKGLATAGSNVSYQPSISGAATNNLLKWNGTTLINSSLSDDGSVTSLTKTSGNTVDLILNQSGVRGWHVQNYATTGQFRVFDGAVNALTLEKTTGAATFISTVTASSFSGSGAGLTGITSGQVTTALGYTPKPTFTENTGFNLPLGTTTGTVLAGRTFGTAASSAVGDFIQNQNTSAQSANMWINGAGTFGGVAASINAISTINTNNSTLSLGNAVGFTGTGAEGARLYYSGSTGNTFLDSYYSNGKIYFRTNVSSGSPVNALMLNNSGTATFSSTVNSTGFLLNGNNLTSSLTTNYIPKWNGSSFVNSLISDDGSVSVSTYPFILKNTTSNVMLLGTYYDAFGGAASTTDGMTYIYGNNKYHIATNGVVRFSIGDYGNASILSPTASTSPTTGALVVNGGMGANHVRANNFYGNGSNLTGVQLPITLTTNGTSGAATFSGNVLNVPNYTSSGGVNQTQTTVNGSTSGTMVCSMPYQTGSYKKVLIALDGLNGSATYTFPSSFSRIPDAVGRGSNGVGISALSTTSITITSTGSTGWCIIEGY